VEIPALIFKRLDEIKQQEVEWLVNEYIPIGVVTLLAGEGGHGKTSLLCDLTAAILKGERWLQKFEVEGGGVIFIATEGADEIRNRLTAYGVKADDPLIVVDLTAWDNYTPLKAAMALPQILEEAKARLGDIPIKLVALDCMRGFGFDEKQASRQKGDRLPTVREIYNPLAEFAGKEGAAVIVTHHFRKLQPDERRRLFPRKKKGKEVAPDIDVALLRNLIAGTTDLVNAARHALVVVSDIEAGTGLIVPVKSNKALVLGSPLKYDWRTDAPTFLHFVDEVEESIIERAMILLKQTLADGAKPSEEVKALAKKEGISETTLRRAKGRLGVVARKQGDCWVWMLPSDKSTPKHDHLDHLDEKTQEKQGVSSWSSRWSLGNNFDHLEAGMTTLTTFQDGQDDQDGHTENQMTTFMTNLKTPINKGFFDQDDQDDHTFGTSDALQPAPQVAPHPTNGNSHNLLPQYVYVNNSGNLREDGKGSPQPAHWVDVVVNVIDVVEVVDTLQTAQPPAPQPVGGVVVVTSDDWKEDESIVVVTSEDYDGSGDWQDGLLLVEAQPTTAEPTPTPPQKPKGKKPIPISDPFCLQCGERLQPDAGGIAVCVGCGKVYDVSITEAEKLRWFANKMLAIEKMKKNGDGGKHPPAPAGNPPSDSGQPDVGGQSPAPFAGANGQSPAPAGNLPDTGQPAFSCPANGNSSSKMTSKQPDGTVVLAWKDKKESVAPAELDCWQPVDEIKEANLPAIDQIPFPPVVVLDLETTDLDPSKGRILAAGLAYFVEGKEVEAKIIKHDDEAEIVAEVFDYLRETANGIGEFILTGYNIADFDLPFIIQRARKLKVACPFRFLKDDDGEIKRFRVAATEGTLKGDPLSYPAIACELPIQVVDALHLVCRWDYTNKVLRNYDLKNVAAHFGLAVEGRPILSPEEIRNAFNNDPATFDAYLLADLRETFAVFAKLVPPYLGVAALTNLPIDKVVTRSTAWVWQEILQRYYDEIPDADEKRKYQGGLVVSREGLWFPCLKIDVASLYPTIMLAYRVHSRKDYQQVALRWLKALTRQRLELKARAKAGDGNAQILQEAMKVLINSLYGFYGTGGYPFNDMDAAAKVTEIGRKVLTLMISAVEDAGGIVVEADTDGVIVCYKDADPQEIFNAVASAIPQPFNFDVEWHNAVVFVSGDKNYIVMDAQGNILTAKGSVWRGRDKERYLTEAIPTFLRIFATQGKDEAIAYAKQVLEEIQSGKGWHWVVRTHKVGKGDKYLFDAGFRVGEVATYAYKNKKARVISRSPAEGYDVDFYAKAFKQAIKEVVQIIHREGDAQDGFDL